MAEALLQVRGLHARHGRSPVLHGVDVEIRPGEIVGLLGRNGAGRSSLLEALMGLLPASGSVRLRGEEILGEPTFRIARRGLGYVPERRDVFPTLSVLQNLELGRWRRGAGRWTTDDAFALFPSLAVRRHAPAGVLSGGEQQMLALCRAMMGDPVLLLVDEPTEGLAPALVAQVADFLRALERRGVSVLLVEQKLAIALDVSRRVLVLGRGRIVFEGTPDELRANEAVKTEWLAA